MTSSASLSDSAAALRAAPPRAAAYSADSTLALRRPPSRPATTIRPSEERRLNPCTQTRPRQAALSPAAFREWLVLEAETGVAAWLRGAVDMVFPRCLPPVISSAPLARLQTIYSHIDLAAQHAELGKWVQFALRNIAIKPQAVAALTDLMGGHNVTEAARTLACGTNSRILFHALQGFIWAKRTPAAQERITANIQVVNNDLAVIAEVPYSEEVPGGADGAVVRLGLSSLSQGRSQDDLTPSGGLMQSNRMGGSLSSLSPGRSQDDLRATTGTWFAHQGLGIQAMALLNATEVSSLLQGPRPLSKKTNQKIKEAQVQAKQFKLGPKTIETLFTNPGAITQWLPHNASMQQMMQELLRRTDDQFEPPPKPATAAAAPAAPA
jgi:hypothetical protein